MRRIWWWVLGVVVVVGLGVAVYMLKPVNGPARDLTLTADVAHGTYLLRLGGCVACHTDVKNEAPMLSGGAPLATPFGSFYPPNITSDPEGGIGNWTLAQFSAAMSDGEGPQGHLYPAFPFDSYTLMSDQEIVDLYAALKEVPPVAQKAPDHQIMFPFNIRLAMAGWKNLFFHPRRYESDPAHSEQWNRGRYLALGPGHCVTCHSPRNIFGAIDPGQELAGNAAGGPGGRAPALTKEALLRDGYTEVGFLDTMKSGFTPNFDILGGAMGEVITDGTSHWTDEDLTALAVYLLGLE